MNIVPTGIDIDGLGLRVLPWLLSFLVVCILITVMLAMEGGDLTKGDTTTVRKVDVAMPPPPEPPPPLKKRPPESSAESPTVDLVGPGQGPSLDYSRNPKLAMINLEKVEQPDVDRNSLDFADTISVDFPVLEVQELDRIPRLVSTNNASFPRALRKRGVEQVVTTVEIIIDQNGQAFVKEIIDPVYPEMRGIIRKAIDSSRFTVPTKNGKPVLAVYVYNLKFIDLSF